MKKTLKTVFLVALAIIAMGSIYAETFEKVELLDDFGDPTGKSYVKAKKDFDGTYKNIDGVSNGKLKWNIKVEEDNVTFLIKENGKVTPLSTALYTTDKFDVKVKDTESGVTTTYSGVVSRGEEGTYNCIEVKTVYDWFYKGNDLASYLNNCSDCKVVISNDRGTYSLGALNGSEIEAIKYDLATFEKIKKAFEAGEYSMVMDMISSFESDDSTSFKHFKSELDEIKKELDEIKKESSYQAIVKKYEQGKYEELIASINEFRGAYKDYKTSELDAMYYDSHEALGLFLVGMKGPAGGYVFYDCDADNDSGNADGLISSECGWRYLEAAPNDLRVVNGVPTVDSSANGYAAAESEYIFGYHKASEYGSNLYVNGTETYSATDCTVNAIGSGEKNTEKLVNAMGESAYSSDYGSRKVPDYAARLCSVLSHGGYDDWFLPSLYELDLMYDNLKIKGIGSFSDYSYWSSYEHRYSSGNACHQSFSGGEQAFNYRSEDMYIRPCRAF